jgi:hypothetical protein
MTKTTQEEKQKAKEFLINLFKEDKKPKVHTSLKYVSRSGMLRHIDVIYIKNNEPISLNWYIEKLGLFNRAKNYTAKNCDSLRVSGCGMDMGFHVVYTLSCVLYGYEHDNAYKLSHKWL